MIIMMVTMIIIIINTIIMLVIITSIVFLTTINGLDACVRTVKIQCPRGTMNPQMAQKKPEEDHQNPVSHGMMINLVELPGLSPYCRARRRTHDTSRTTRTRT